MTNRSCTCPFIRLAAIPLRGIFSMGIFSMGIVAGGLANTAWAQSSGRSIVAGRQQVQAALVVALADGTLSRTEQYSILQKGKRLLPPDELQGLKQTLLRLTTAEQIPVTAVPHRARTGQNTLGHYADHVVPAQGTLPTSQPKPADEDEDDEKTDTRSAAYQEPAEAKGDKNPFKDEDLLEPLKVGQDTPITFSGDFQDGQDCPSCQYGPGCQSCGGGGDICQFDRGGYSETCWSPDLRLSTSAEAFEGPLDLDGQNGNFGLKFAVNAGMPLSTRWGIGTQVGTSAVLADFHGTQFTGSEIRTQNFTTVGLFQRLPFRARRLKYGFAFDWLFDDYYSDLKMSQWRVKLAYELTCYSEIGIWSAIPNDGDNAVLGDGVQGDQLERFKPLPQGVFYYNRCWESGASTTAWLGIAEDPGQFVFGGDARLPLSCHWSLIGNVNYILPSASGIGGQDEELWYVSLGIEFTPGWGGNHCQAKKFSPMFPLANNGNFAVGRF